MAHNIFHGQTQKAGFIGNDSDENQFDGPNGERYFLQINPDTGKQEVWNEEWGSDKFVGEYVDGKFVPNENWWGGARPEEVEFFNSDKGRTAVNNHAETVMENEEGRVNQADPPRNLNEQEQKEVLSDTRANTVDGQQTQADDSAIAQNNRNEALANVGGTAVGRERYGHYCYPITLRRGQQDRLRISVLKFKPKGISGTNFMDRNSRVIATSSRVTRGGGTELTNYKDVGSGRRGFLQRTSIGSVILPVNNITDSNAVAWESGNMNAMQIAAANVALSAMEGNVKEGLGIAGDIGSTIGKDEMDAVTQFFAGQATGVKGLFARTAGAVINPNMELIFKGPQLRSFGFTYQLTPRDPKESKEILKIIRLFKQSMAVKTTEKNLFLKAPNTYRLEYYTSGRDKSHPYLPKIKECALTKFDVNYTPNNTYMTYEDSSMVQYEITFAFQELDPLYNNDYTDLDQDTDGSLGY